MKKSIIIVTHYFSPGTSQGLRNYCQRNDIDYIYIEHPLFASMLMWFFGTVDTFIKIIFLKKGYDIYFGSNRLNTFVGVLLKKLGKVNKVIYFSPDWSPKRFDNQLINYIYQKLDYFCVKFSDITWNSSAIMKVDPMMNERKKLGYPNELINKQTQLPDGCDYFDILPINKINRYQVGFVGHLIDRSGIDLVIDAYPIIKNSIPELSVLIIGSGDQEALYRQLTKKYNIEFTGFMGNIFDVYKLLSKCAIAIAPYKPGTISQYTDPGKVKNYLSVGLPIVITKVPEIAKEIDRKKCGVAVNYDKKEFAGAVIKLLKNDKLLNQYRSNTKKMAKKYLWDNIFDNAFSKL